MTFLKVTILIISLTKAFSCSCFLTPFEKQYCDSNTVLLGRVVAKFDNCPGGACDPIKNQDKRITYFVTVRKTIKGTKAEDGVMHLHTAVSGALCGIKLRLYATYLFTLNASSFNVGVCPLVSHRIGLCDNPALWKSLSKKQKRFVRKNAKSNDRYCRSVDSPLSYVAGQGSLVRESSAGHLE